MHLPRCWPDIRPQDVRNLSLVAPQYRDWEIGEFVQDDWRATRWLTLNLGLRYDIFTPFREKHNHLSNFDPTNPAMLASGMIQVAGVNGVSDTLNIGTQFGDVQPRTGFAATLGHGMVLRGGFGMSYWPNNVASPYTLKTRRSQPTTRSIRPSAIQRCCLRIPCRQLHRRRLAWWPLVATPVYRAFRQLL